MNKEVKSKVKMLNTRIIFRILTLQLLGLIGGKYTFYILNYFLIDYEISMLISFYQNFSSVTDTGLHHPEYPRVPQHFHFQQHTLRFYNICYVQHNTDSLRCCWNSRQRPIHRHFHSLQRKDNVRSERTRETCRHLFHRRCQ